MQRHFLAGQQAAEQLAARLPLDAAPQQAPEAARIMALNATNFARTAGLALEAADPDAAWALTGLTARLLDWLWPVLEEEQAVIAAEAHVKLASLAAAFRGDADESARQLEAARERFRDLGARTGNGEYLPPCRQRRPRRGRGGGAHPRDAGRQPGAGAGRARRPLQRAGLCRRAKRRDRAGGVLF